MVLVLCQARCKLLCSLLHPQTRLILQLPYETVYPPESEQEDRHHGKYEPRGKAKVKSGLHFHL